MMAPFDASPTHRTNACGRRPARGAAVAITVVAAALSLTQPAAAAVVPPTVPARIAVPAGNTPFLVGHAVGVQIYTCNATGGSFAWTLVAPDARLYDDHGKRIISHYAGPTWEAKDASRVVGARVDGVTVDPKAIPWLLLSATSTGRPGLLAQTTFIQRLETRGGLAPAAGACNRFTVGARVKVPYTADYYFWRKTPA
jgi:hypothetical protein